MKQRILSFSLATLLCVFALQAEAAKRMGGGQSFGRQSSNVTQHEAARPATPGPTQSVNNPAPAPAVAPAAAPAAPRRPWGSMLGGLATGLGLAWLAHSMGWGAAFGEFLLMGVLALVLMVVVGRLWRRKPQAPGRTFAFQAAGPESAAFAPQYNPKNVGNDASARPWEGGAHFEAPAPASAATSTVGQAAAWGIPAGFDAPGFVAAAKAHFITLQDAWDRSDMQALRAMMTDEMLGEIRQQLAEREGQSGGQPNKTEVVVLEAQLLGIEDLGSGHMASVEFSGLIKEDQSAGPNPFREVWNMTRTKDSADGWLVAGVQAFQ